MKPLVNRADISDPLWKCTTKFHVNLIKVYLRYSIAIIMEHDFCRSCNDDKQDESTGETKDTYLGPQNLLI